MNRLCVAMVLAIVAALSTSLSAQWPLRPAADIPKGPDGKPNLTAPAPRTADGKPDLSGVWMIDNGPESNGAGRPPRVTGGNAGAGFKDGLPFQPWAAELQKKRAAEIGLNDPDGLCLPQGPLQYHIDPQPLKIAQMPRQILIIYESNYGLRTIYMDGRSLPPQGSVEPYWHGYSVGRWEGDTLVVESNNFHGVDPNNPRAVGLPDSYLGAGWLDHRREPVYRGDEVDRAIPACELRTAGHRVHRRRPEGVYQALYRQSPSADCGGRLGTDRIHLPREPDVPEEHRPRTALVLAEKGGSRTLRGPLRSPDWF